MAVGPLSRKCILPIERTVLGGGVVPAERAGPLDGVYRDREAPTPGSFLWVYPGLLDGIVFLSGFGYNKRMSLHTRNGTLFATKKAEKLKEPEEFR
ncbi:MAG: hypothetical protein LBU25_04230, partial [Treponema sp.]|nr:hypothetical protein [Treponema sp.]